MSNSTQSPSTMPERYRPDPWIDSQYGCRDAQKSTVIRVPTIAVRDWLGLAEGDHVGVAPCGPRSVWFGPAVPRELGDTQTIAQNDRATFTLFLPASVADYLDLGAGDTVRYHRPEKRRPEYPRVKVERLPREVTDK